MLATLLTKRLMTTHLNHLTIPQNLVTAIPASCLLLVSTAKRICIAVSLMSCSIILPPLIVTSHRAFSHHYSAFH